MTGIFTLDAVVALSIVTVLLTASLYMFSEPKTVGMKHLYHTATDMLAILDANGGLDRLVVGDTSKLDELQSSLPQKFCYELTLVNSTDDVVFKKNSGCQQKKYSISRRSFARENIFYIAEVRTWLR